MIDQRLRSVLDGLAAEHRLRHTRAFAPAGPGRASLNGRELVNLSSNDYLGLARHPELAERAALYAARWGTGAGSSRLICGTLEIHQALEARLAALKGAPAALILGSGFSANATVLAALLDRQVLGAEPLVFSDRLNHASMHEGCRLAGVRQIRYRHLDLDHLAHLLDRHAGSTAPRFILSETVFSMDGDRADVEGVAELARRHGAFLYLDEAHAVGVLGPGGRGLAAGIPLERGLVLGTFSKALGAYGAYVCCSATVREYLVNRAAGFIFSTALPPPVLGAVDAALDRMAGMNEERRELADNAALLRRLLNAAGLGTGGSSTQIVPVLVGEARDALTAALALEEAGFLAVAVRPPTVPAGTSRLRLSLTCAHDRACVERAARAVIAVLGRQAKAGS